MYCTQYGPYCTGTVHGVEITVHVLFTVWRLLYMYCTRCGVYRVWRLLYMHCTRYGAYCTCTDTVWPLLYMYCTRVALTVHVLYTVWRLLYVHCTLCGGYCTCTVDGVALTVNVPYTVWRLLFMYRTWCGACCTCTVHGGFRLICITVKTTPCVCCIDQAMPRMFSSYSIQPSN